MKYLLDSNICIHFFRGKFNLLQKFENVGKENLAISEITLLELIYGAEKSQNSIKNYEFINQFIVDVKVLSISNTIYRFGKEKAMLSKLGRNISDFDLLIACTALENNLIMVTENVGEFIRIQDLTIENWINR